MRRFLRKLRALWHRRRLDRDLEDEICFHLDMKSAETGDRAESRRRFGNPTVLKEACREMWTFTALETWWQDLRYACRAIAKTPGFDLMAVTALALVIGADTGVFTIASGAISWNLGLDHLDRILLVGLADRGQRQEFGGASYPDFRDVRTQTKSLAGLA